jgi:hypothetical protein
VEVDATAGSSTCGTGTDGAGAVDIMELDAPPGASTCGTGIDTTGAVIKAGCVEVCSDGAGASGAGKLDAGTTGDE